MRLRLPLSLRSALLACSVLFTTVASASVSDGNLGNVMYIGDSITHGVNSGSWRWAMHKIFTDNGVSYTEKGIMTGNFSGGVAAGTSYGGKIFQNIHSSAASARTYEIAGRANGSNYGRFDGSNIKNWLGLSTEKTKGGSYAGQTFTGANKPDTFFLLSGTNDLLSDGDNNSLFYRLDGVTSLLLGDMDSIVSSIRTANSQASILVMTIPCWTQHSNGNLAETHQAVASYNESLKEWGTNNAANGVKVIDINAGIIDAASSTPFYGVRSMFNNPTADGLHPNAQGDLLMAGNLAKGMGYAGRSAGQERKATHELEVNFGQNPSITQQTLEANGFTANNVSISNNTVNFNKSGSSTLTYNWGAAQVPRTYRRKRGRGQHACNPHRRRVFARSQSYRLAYPRTLYRLGGRVYSNILCKHGLRRRIHLDVPSRRRSYVRCVLYGNRLRNFAQVLPCGCDIRRGARLFDGYIQKIRHYERGSVFCDIAYEHTHAAS